MRLTRIGVGRLLILSLAALAGLAAVMVSTNHAALVAVDSGGGGALSANLALRGSSIGGAVAAGARSVNYVVYTGPLQRRAGQPVSTVVVENVSKSALRGGEQCTLRWRSTAGGTYYVEVGGNGSPGSGTQVATGSCTGGASVNTAIQESVLPDNQRHPIYVIVDAGSYTRYAGVVIVDDQVEPDAAFTRITVSGTVADDSVEVRVNGAAVPVSDRKYEAQVTTSMDMVTVQAAPPGGVPQTWTITTW